MQMVNVVVKVACIAGIVYLGSKAIPLIKKQIDKEAARQIRTEERDLLLSQCLAMMAEIKLKRKLSKETDDKFGVYLLDYPRVRAMSANLDDEGMDALSHLHCSLRYLVEAK